MIFLNTHRITDDTNQTETLVRSSAGLCVKPEISPEDIALFQYTGGTTGIAKAAVARHRNLVANALQFKAWMSTLEEEKETFLLALPVYHIYGMVCGMLLGMALRASLVITPEPARHPGPAVSHPDPPCHLLPGRSHALQRHQQLPRRWPPGRWTCPASRPASPALPR